MARKHPARAEQPRAIRLLAALMLLLALATGQAPAARVAPEVLAFDAALVICHAGTDGDAALKRSGDNPSPTGDCKQCPACHIVAQPVLPVSDSAFVVVALVYAPSHAAATPPATGPPRPVSAGTPPTGPPAASV